MSGKGVEQLWWLWWWVLVNAAYLAGVLVGHAAPKSGDGAISVGAAAGLAIGCVSLCVVALLVYCGYRIGRRKR